MYWRGELQAANAAVSSQHSNVAPVSLAAKPNLALVVGTVGEAVIVVS